MIKKGYNTLYICIINFYIEKRDVDVRVPEIGKLNPDHILSFNYTDTYKRVYGVDKSINYNYIHGKSEISNTVESNNMVWGIDEYLGSDREDK